MHQFQKIECYHKKRSFSNSFFDEMLERLVGKSFFYFLDWFSSCFQIVEAKKDQEKTTFTCPFMTFTYRYMPFGLCNALDTFQRCMMSIFSNLIENYIEIFMDNCIVYDNSFDQCLNHLTKVLKHCININLVLNYEKCHFIVQQEIVLGHVVFR